MRVARKFMSVMNETGLSLLVLSGFACGQAKLSTIEVSTGRPLASAVLEIEKIAGIAINYEDVRYEHSADLQDVTDAVMRPEQRALAPAGARVIVPRGGRLSVPVAVDATTGKLLDVPAITTALNAVLAANNSGGFAGKFTLENYGGVFFVHPAQVRDAGGATVAATPVLTTPVSFPQQQRNGAQTIDLILSQVSKVTGFRIELGMIP